MKKEVSPLSAGTVIVLVVIVAGFLLWKGTSGGGNLPPGAVGNPGPFAPGGVATSSGGMPNEAKGQGGPPRTGPGSRIGGAPTSKPGGTTGR